MEPNRRDLIKSSAALGIASLHPGLMNFAFASASPHLGNPFLEGNYAPVKDEVAIEELRVEGVIPRELRGCFLRNGPNPLYPAAPYHLFDGDGMIHGLYFKDSKVSYRNRWIRTQGLVEEMKARKNLYGGIIAGTPIKNPANTSLIYHHGRLLALWEAGEPYEINPSDLGTIGSYRFGGTLTQSFTAHPKIDPTTQELIFFGYNTVQNPYINYGVADRHGKLIHQVPISLPYPVMMHDFAVTKNYSLFLFLPMVMKHLSVGFKPELGAKIGILPRYGSAEDLIWIDIEPCFVFHTLNAYEDQDQIILHASRFKTFDLFSSTGESSPYQWRLDLATRSCEEGPLSRLVCDFPVMNPYFVGRRNRFGYFDIAGREMFRGIAKFDLDRLSVDTFEFEKETFGSDTIFVPKSELHEEDDGWLMNFTFNVLRQESEVILLDAKNLKEPLARIKIPIRVPYGFHSYWLRDVG